VRGYLKRLGPLTLAAFAGRIMNTHPALLPEFGGQGMYGRNVHRAVLAAGRTVSGATVHWVDAHYDTGAVISQVRVPVGSSPGGRTRTSRRGAGGGGGGQARTTAGGTRAERYFLTARFAAAFFFLDGSLGRVLPKEPL
jgi:hypothetical protein